MRGDGVPMVQAYGLRLPLTPTPAPRPGPRQRRGRSKARAPVARKPCLLAPQGEGLWYLAIGGVFFDATRRPSIPRSLFPVPGRSMPDRGRSTADADSAGDVNVSVADVLAAQARLRRFLPPTPLHYAERFGTWLKLENLQRTGSYKVRGALNAMLAALERGDERPVICASAGNHAQGV